jgi:hypothetical protein
MGKTAVIIGVTLVALALIAGWQVVSCELPTRRFKKTCRTSLRKVVPGSDFCRRAQKKTFGTASSKRPEHMALCFSQAR